MKFKIEPDLLVVLSELFVDLAAAWFGAVFIVPNFAAKRSPFNLAILTGDVLAGILSLTIAFRLKNFQGREND